MCDNHKWAVGQYVKAGFNQVTVKACLSDGSYICVNSRGDKLYRFIPHRGLHGITLAEAQTAMSHDAARRQAMADRETAINEARLANAALFAGAVC